MVLPREIGDIDMVRAVGGDADRLVEARRGPVASVLPKTPAVPGGASVVTTPSA